MSLVLQKSLLAAEILAQGIPAFTAACVTEPSLAHFVGVLTRLRLRHAALLQPFWFSSPRDLAWHGTHWGEHSLLQCPCPRTGHARTPLRMHTHHILHVLHWIQVLVECRPRWQQRVILYTAGNPLAFE